MPGLARFSVVALDCPDPRALAAFYQGVTGWEVGTDDDGWVELRSGGGATLAFQRVADHRPPVWPSSEHPQQLHLDFEVGDLDEGERGVLALGARRAEPQPGGHEWRVYLDPAGHPFCLVRSDS